MSDEQVPTAGQADGASTDYETATARLDEIIARLDSGDAQLRETLDLCSEAKTLIEYCATELAAVDEGLRELRLEDLAASLRTSSGQPADLAAPDPASADSALTEAPGSDDGSSGDDQPPPPEEPPF